jgi:hypothetical protein
MISEQISKEKEEQEDDVARHGKVSDKMTARYRISSETCNH